MFALACCPHHLPSGTEAFRGALQQSISCSGTFCGSFGEVLPWIQHCKSLCAFLLGKLCSATLQLMGFEGLLGINRVRQGWLVPLAWSRSKLGSGILLLNVIQNVVPHSMRGIFTSCILCWGWLWVVEHWNWLWMCAVALCRCLSKTWSKRNASPALGTCLPYL